LQCIVRWLEAAVDDSCLGVSAIDKFLIPSLQTITMPFQDTVFDSVVKFLSAHITRLEGLGCESTIFSRWKSLTHSTLTKYKLVSARFDVLQAPGLFGFIETLLHDDVNLLKNPQWLYTLPNRISNSLALGADPNGYNMAGRTVLMAVLESMENCDIPGDISKALVDMLLAYGADLRLRDRDGNTALHYAVRTQIPQVVKMIIGSGVDIHARNLNGESGMGLAVKQYELARPKQLPAAKKAYGVSQNTLVKFFDAGGRRSPPVPSILEPAHSDL
jgi:ankyrin repeat protein